ncbi:MAG: leucine-rich repeat domain-containing protein [Tyzzerella sp.]|nr:leucine-rich repeat domain-containing protein [Tyzzerella sp.]
MSIYIEKVKDNVLLKFIPGTRNEELIIPDYVEVIGTGICNPEPECNFLNDTFIVDNWDFFAVKRLVIPNTVKVIKPGAFWNIPNLEEIVIDENSPAGKLIDGVLFSKDGKRLICCPAARTGEYTVPEGVEIIGENGFDHSNLEKIILPDGLKEIENDVFFVGYDIKEVYIPATVQKIGTGIFDCCDEPIIKAPKGSYAIQYALEHEIKYEEI